MESRLREAIQRVHDVQNAAELAVAEAQQAAQSGGGGGCGPLLRSFHTRDRTITREAMIDALRTAIDVLGFSERDVQQSIAAGKVTIDDVDGEGAGGLESAPTLSWLTTAVVDTDALWAFCIERGVFGPLATPDARLVSEALDQAQTVDQLERIAEVVRGVAADMRGARDGSELSMLLSIQRSVESGSALRDAVSLCE